MVAFSAAWLMLTVAILVRAASQHARDLAAPPERSRADGLQVLMEGLSAFLHALRLCVRRCALLRLTARSHWVEANSYVAPTLLSIADTLQ